MLAGDDRRFLGEDVLQYREEVEDGGFLKQSISPIRATRHTIPAYIPEGRPADKVGMINLPLRVDVLAGAHCHGLIRRHID